MGDPFYPMCQPTRFPPFYVGISTRAKTIIFNHRLHGKATRTRVPTQSTHLLFGVVPRHRYSFSTALRIKTEERNPQCARIAESQSRDLRSSRQATTMIKEGIRILAWPPASTFLHLVPSYSRDHRTDKYLPQTAVAQSYAAILGFDRTTYYSAQSGRRCSRENVDSRSCSHASGRASTWNGFEPAKPSHQKPCADLRACDIRHVYSNNVADHAHLHQSSPGPNLWYR